MRRIMLLLPALLLVSFKPKERRPTIEIWTNYGTMRLMLYNETPLHRDNMLKLVRQGFYDSLLFHRVIKDFMIQGGDPESRHAQPGAMLGRGEIQGAGRIPAEFRSTLIHQKGALAAARDNNPEKASSNCQFYIVQGKKISTAELDAFQQRNGMTYTAEQRRLYETVGGTPHLDNNYTVFGQLIEGMDVLDAIAAVATDRNDRPLQDVRMVIREGKPIKVK
ncbi:MAG: peptidylprolyl isomerase [Chitinophagales bacterium]|nr:peptidylprolyl isomerase [Chitinophagales bacterium]MDW8394439.1 peptidylprolyl isomerase [Chitinophagales bacterium]